MANEKFNPIAELPILPGSEIANDELESNIIDSTYPPIEKPVKDTPKPQIEIRLKPADKKEKKEETDRLTVTRIIILIGVLAFVLLGIFLTLRFVPKITNSISSLSKSFTSIFTLEKAIGPMTTSTTTTASQIPLVATSTAHTPVVIPISTTTPQVKTPAKIVANIISTEVIGNREIVKFNIQNIGGTTSGTWSFSVTLPSSMTPKYYSVVQTALAPQSGVIYTLGFTPDRDLPIKIEIY